MLVAIGRRAFTGNLGLEAVGVATERGRMVVDGHFQTNVPGVYAIGDVIRGPMLAHKAEDEGVAVAEILAGQAGHVNYGAIPAVVYTSPEIASVGKTRRGAEGRRRRLQGRQVPLHCQRPGARDAPHGGLRQNPRRRCDRPGARRAYPRLRRRGDDPEAVVLMEFGGSAEDLARTCHAHPTMSEAVKEAAMAVDKRAIHI